MKCMFLNVAWRNVKDEWRKEVPKKPMLSMMKLMESEVKSSCALLKSKTERRMMLKLRGGTAASQIEMGRWHGMKREESVCKECDSGEMEDVCHWLLQCSAWDHLRQPLLEAMEESIEGGRTSKEHWRESSLPLYCHWLVRTIVYYCYSYVSLHLPWCMMCAVLHWTMMCPSAYWHGALKIMN